jgi:hypothetical protein
LLLDPVLPSLFVDPFTAECDDEDDCVVDKTVASPNLWRFFGTDEAGSGDTLRFCDERSWRVEEVSLLFTLDLLSLLLLLRDNRACVLLFLIWDTIESCSSWLSSSPLSLRIKWDLDRDAFGLCSVSPISDGEAGSSWRSTECVLDRVRNAIKSLLSCFLDDEPAAVVKLVEWTVDVVANDDEYDEEVELEKFLRRLFVFLLFDDEVAGTSSSVSSSVVLFVFSNIFKSLFLWGWVRLLEVLLLFDVAGNEFVDSFFGFDFTDFDDDEVDVTVVWPPLLKPPFCLLLRFRSLVPFSEPVAVFFFEADLFWLIFDVLLRFSCPSVNAESSNCLPADSAIDKTYSINTADCH